MFMFLCQSLINALSEILITIKSVDEYPSLIIKLSVNGGLIKNVNTKKKKAHWCRKKGTIPVKNFNINIFKNRISRHMLSTDLQTLSMITIVLVIDVFQKHIYAHTRAHFNIG